MRARGKEKGAGREQERAGRAQSCIGRRPVGEEHGRICVQVDDKAVASLSTSTCTRSPGCSVEHGQVPRRRGRKLERAYDEAKFQRTSISARSADFSVEHAPVSQRPSRMSEEQAYMRHPENNSNRSRRGSRARPKGTAPRSRGGERRRHK